MCGAVARSAEGLSRLRSRVRVTADSHTKCTNRQKEEQAKTAKTNNIEKPQTQATSWQSLELHGTTILTGRPDAASRQVKDKLINEKQNDQKHPTGNGTRRDCPRHLRAAPRLPHGRGGPRPLPP